MNTLYIDGKPCKEPCDILFPRDQRKPCEARFKDRTVKLYNGLMRAGRLGAVKYYFSTKK